MPYRFWGLLDSCLAADEVEAVMNKLNHRPRKALKFKTPHTVFFADSLQEAA
jgi:IS30 family transposase